MKKETIEVIEGEVEDMQVPSTEIPSAHELCLEELRRWMMRAKTGDMKRESNNTFKIFVSP